MTSIQVQSLIDTVFDYHGSGLNTPRKGQTTATGFQIFSRTSPPTFDILIAAATKVSSTAQSNVPAVGFQTQSSVTMLQSLASSYLNPNNGLYEITAPIIALVPGATGSQNAGAINVLVSQINGISATRNPTATQGLDKEQNSVYVERIKSAIPGSNPGTDTGVFDTAFKQTNVSDVAVVGANDPLMTRDMGVGGKVDVYIQTNDNDLQQVSDEKHVYAGATSYAMAKQPVEANLNLFPITVKVFNAAGAQVGALTLTTHFTFVKDRSSNQWSSKAADKILVNSAGDTYVTGLSGTELRITYSYDSRTAIVQAVFDDPDGHEITCDILVRKAKYADLSVSITGRQIAGFSNSQIVQSISNIISAQFLIDKKILGVGGVISVISANLQNQAQAIGLTEITGITFTLSQGNDDLAQTSAVIDSVGDASIDRVEFFQFLGATFTAVP